MTPGMLTVPRLVGCEVEAVVEVLDGVVAVVVAVEVDVDVDVDVVVSLKGMPGSGYKAVADIAIPLLSVNFIFAIWTVPVPLLAKEIITTGPLPEK